MKKYKWTLEIEVEAEDELEAEAKIEEAVEEMTRDPNGILDYGELEEIRLSGLAVMVDDEYEF